MKEIKFEDLVRCYGSTPGSCKTDILIKHLIKKGYDIAYIDTEATLDMKKYNKFLKEKK